jgi:hypothetical protein
VTVEELAAQRAALLAARFRGVRTVEVYGRRVTYASDAEMAIVSGVGVSSISALVPSWAWPLILISVTALFQSLRNLADKRHQAELAEPPLCRSARSPLQRSVRKTFY